eukprot:TRINITY_DN8746_c0_g3_i1.p1 TRINITY_DN8746_c0_g3~~TRINITY_DN8746_c0_g3_i1.p1  ORF type:complete len:682 (-),score=182.51 TRINITY_DN8746_c0_g3_i1:64-2109(-)
MHSRTKECLRDVNVLQSCSDEFIEALAASTTSKVFSAGHVFFAIGEPANAMYMLNIGAVEVVIYRAVDDGPLREEVVATLSDGDIFGEIGALCQDDRKAVRSATVRAKSFCDCRLISREALQRAISDFQEDGAKIKELAMTRMIALAAAQKGLKQSRRTSAGAEALKGVVGAVGGIASAVRRRMSWSGGTADAKDSAGDASAEDGAKTTPAPVQSGRRNSMAALIGGLAAIVPGGSFTTEEGAGGGDDDSVLSDSSEEKGTSKKMKARRASLPSVNDVQTRTIHVDPPTKAKQSPAEVAAQKRERARWENVFVTGNEPTATSPPVVQPSLAAKFLGFVPAPIFAPGEGPAIADAARRASHGDNAAPESEAIVPPKRLPPLLGEAAGAAVPPTNSIGEAASAEKQSRGWASMRRASAEQVLQISEAARLAAMPVLKQEPELPPTPTAPASLPALDHKPMGKSGKGWSAMRRLSGASLMQKSEIAAAASASAAAARASSPDASRAASPTSSGSPRAPVPKVAAKGWAALRRHSAGVAAPNASNSRSSSKDADAGPAKGFRRASLPAAADNDPGDRAAMQTALAAFASAKPKAEGAGSGAGWAAVRRHSVAAANLGAGSSGSSLGGGTVVSAKRRVSLQNDAVPSWQQQQSPAASMRSRLSQEDPLTRMMESGNVPRTARQRRA